MGIWGSRVAPMTCGNTVDGITLKDLRLRDLRMVYQPIVDIFESKLVAFEALLRWHHPSLGELRTLATPKPMKDWSLTSLREKLIKIGAKVIRHGRYVAFQMAEVALPRHC